VGEESVRLIVRQSDSTVSEFEFTEGPIYIGRHLNSQIYLRNRAVSRQHAVLHRAQDGKWMVEDLDSANKTYLNDEAVHTAEIKSGDVLRIIDFTIEISLEDDAEAEKPIDLEDTLTKTAYSMKATSTTPPDEIIVRKADAGHAPAMRLPAQRLVDFSEATDALNRAYDIDELLLSLLDITLKQFGAYRTWCALREQAGGPMTYHAGKQRSGQKVELSEIKLNEKITEAVDKGEFMVIPRVSAEIEGEEGILSAIIVPIMSQAGCLGVLYVDNAIDSEHYSLSDLDYLMLLAIHTAAVMKRL
jgi:pSer/pThr/pTyr-binding forkhead associated (FHA) protein